MPLFTLSVFKLGTIDCRRLCSDRQKTQRKKTMSTKIQRKHPWDVLRRLLSETSDFWTLFTVVRNKKKKTGTLWGLIIMKKWWASANNPAPWELQSLKQTPNLFESRCASERTPERGQPVYEPHHWSAQLAFSRNAKFGSCASHWNLLNFLLEWWIK